MPAPATANPIVGLPVAAPPSVPAITASSVVFESLSFFHADLRALPVLLIASMVFPSSTGFPSLVSAASSAAFSVRCFFKSLAIAKTFSE